MNSYQHVATGIVLPLLLAVFGLFDLKQRPTFATFHRVDVFPVGGMRNVPGHRINWLHRVSSRTALVV
jgi:hypothetical protein